MDIVNLMDLSFLTSKEQAIIQEVLKRDANLRKREERRIRKMRRKTLDYRSTKLQTGEWFEDLKAKRFLEYPSASDLLQSVLHQDAKAGFVQSRTSCLNKIQFLQMLLSDSTSTAHMAKRSVGENNFTIKEECSPSPGSDEQLSITQILKDLELFLDREIKNSSSNAENSDINGFSPKNVMVDKKLPTDYSSHQVWHYPGLLNLPEILPSLSPIKTANPDSGQGFLTMEYNYAKHVGMKDIQHHKQICQSTEKVPVAASVGLFEEPFCSSPCLATQFPGEHLEYAAEYNDTSCIKTDETEPKVLTEHSCETTLEMESTIELSTIVANKSLGEHVSLIDTTLQDDAL